MPKCNNCIFNGTEIRCNAEDNHSLCKLSKTAIENKNPTIFQKAKNYGIAVVKHLLDGLVNVSEEEYVYRLVTCKECEHRSLDDTKPECLICGCPVNEKARWRSENCPIGRWYSDPANVIEKAPSVSSEAPKRPEGGIVPPKQQTPPATLQNDCGCGNK